MSLLSITVERPDGGTSSVTVVRLAGEADLTTVELADALNAEVAKLPKLLAVDMSGLMFADSSALRMIIHAQQRLSRDGGAVALISPSPAVARTLALSGIDQLIPVHGHLGEATSLMASDEGS